MFTVAPGAEHPLAPLGDAVREVARDLAPRAS
jgi:hypothetical protein